ncbi:MAG: TerC family protein [Ignavibacteriaceae bacterium]|nr:TerC family protein [Ignavibacteriaceae bacterium]
MCKIYTTEAVIELLTLVALEIVLGIDNVISISILSGKLPQEQQNRAGVTRLSLTIITRIALLFSITLIMKLTAPVFNVWGNEISGRDMILIIGGLFLLAKSTREIHKKLEGEEHEQKTNGAAKFGSVIFQILLLDLVFSLDSVITAVGMVGQLWVMITAVIVAVIFMLAFSGKISDFVNHRPTIKMLALSFLLLIGFTLILEGFDQHVPKGYIYFGMAFSFFVELLNLRATRKKRIEPVKLRVHYK